MTRLESKRKKTRLCGGEGVSRRAKCPNKDPSPTLGAA